VARHSAIDAMSAFFFNSREEQYRVLVPFVRDGLERGKKIVHTIDPERRAEHLERLLSNCLKE
jgi:archaellum biogenesis ATPase FlaH